MAQVHDAASQVRHSRHALDPEVLIKAAGNLHPLIKLKLRGVE